MKSNYRQEQSSKIPRTSTICWLTLSLRSFWGQSRTTTDTCTVNRLRKNRVWLVCSQVAKGGRLSPSISESSKTLTTTSCFHLATSRAITITGMTCSSMLPWSLNSKIRAVISSAKTKTEVSCKRHKLNKNSMYSTLQQHHQGGRQPEWLIWTYLPRNRNSRSLT